GRLPQTPPPPPPPRQTSRPLPFSKNPPGGRLPPLRRYGPRRSGPGNRTPVPRPGSSDPRQRGPPQRTPTASPRRPANGSADRTELNAIGARRIGEPSRTPQRPRNVSGENREPDPRTHATNFLAPPRTHPLIRLLMHSLAPATAAHNAASNTEPLEYRPGDP